MKFFDMYIKNNGNLLTTMEELGLTFEDYVALRASPDFEAKLALANEVLASVALADARGAGGGQLVNYELKNLQVGPRPFARRTAADGPGFVINLVGKDA